MVHKAVVTDIFVTYFLTGWINLGIFHCFFIWVSCTQCPL